MEGRYGVSDPLSYEDSNRVTVTGKLKNGYADIFVKQHSEVFQETNGNHFFFKVQNQGCRLLMNGCGTSHQARETLASAPHNDRTKGLYMTFLLRTT